MAITTLAVFMVSVGCFAKFSNFFGVVDNSGDNRAYINVAAAIRHWGFHGLFIKHFWGLPYVMAAVSTVTRTSDRASLLLVCLLSSVVGTILTFRLWGGWIAGFFAVLNFEWMQRSCLGGSEPLFVVLLFASFLAVRRERWILAALLASFSTTVRPLGFLALAGIGLTLLWKREYRTLSIAVAVGAAIGAAYVLPLWWLFGDPLATAHNYQSQGGHRLFGLPLYAIVKGTFLYPAPWTSLVLSFGWILFVLAGTVAMFASESFRTYFRSRPVEIFFAVTYLFLIFSYNSPYWARGTFQRFAIPIIPFVVSALLPWIPKSRGLLWGLGIVSPVLAAASAIGIRNVFHIHL